MNESFTPRELHGFRLIGYVIGNFGLTLLNIFVGVFIFQFYVYTINLDSILTSIGISIQYIISAIAAIIFGVMADNKKPGKFGKRRPFLIVGLPIWLCASILLWFPPWYCPEINSFFWPTAFYFWIMNIIRSTSGTLMTCVQGSMLPEQSQTHENRQKVASLSTFLTICASILSIFTPLMIQSILNDPENVKWWQPSGRVLLFYIPLIASLFAILGAFLYFLTILSIDESFHKNKAHILIKKKTIKSTFKQMFKPTKDKKFRKQLVVEFFNSMAGNIFGIIIIPFMTYSLKLRETEFLFYTLASIIGKFGAYFLFRKINKQKGFIKSYSTCIAIGSFFALLDLIFLFDILLFEIKIVVFVMIVGLILGTIYGIGLFSSPLTSALVYEMAAKDELMDINETVSSLTGSYYGLVSFLISTGPALSSFLLGLILTGANQKNPIIITLCLSSMGIFYLISLLFLRKIKLEERLLEGKSLSSVLKDV